MSKDAINAMVGIAGMGMVAGIGLGVMNNTTKLITGMNPQPKRRRRKKSRKRKK